MRNFSKSTGFGLDPFSFSQETIIHKKTFLKRRFNYFN
jgi:hypothetical protein